MSKKNKCMCIECAIDSMPDFIVDATNVYRTSHYIVRQIVSPKNLDDGTVGMVSCDTFFTRNKLRNEQYEILFENRKRIDGKRLPSTLCTRHYVD